MQWRIVLFCVLALVWAAPADAKGPVRATLTGPGLKKALVFLDYGDHGHGSLSLLTRKGGFLTQVFGTPAGILSQGEALARQPQGALGPRYMVVYRLPGPNTVSLIRQELYPYAAKPVTYMPKLRFWRTRTTPGGWYEVAPGLKALLVKAGLPNKPRAKWKDSCTVTKPNLPSNRYGDRRLWVELPSGGVLRVRRNQPDGGMFGTKVGWIPDRNRRLTLSVSGRRLDAPGRMRVLGVFWGHNIRTGKESWASAIAFPAGGCWRITGRAGPTTVSYVVTVVTVP